MIISKLHIENYKQLRCVTFTVNPDINIFVGENDSGKSTILEAISILSSGKLNGYAFDKQIKANLFNIDVRNAYKASLSQYPNVNELPSMIFEAYCETDEAIYSGTNNSLGENCSGIRVAVEFNPEYTPTYKKLLAAGEIFDIPVEFYTVSYKYFNGDIVTYRFCPIKAVFIDTTKNDYSSVVGRFVTENIATYLSPQEQIDLCTAYRKSRYDFHNNEIVKKLNQSVKENVRIGNRALTIDLKEEVDEWKKQLSVVVDETPFENVGFGSQNTIKIELALKNSTEQVNMVLMEEPENNLSFTNMAKLVQHVQNTVGKQVFISTHSSFISNKLNLGNLLLVNNGEITSLKDLPDDTTRYFKKLPGYDTLRLVLAEKIILVEGPTDELIVQRAYLDMYGKLPAADGIDIIVVGSVAFKRYCDIAILLNKKVVIITDNDGCIKEKIEEKYKEYLGKDNLVFFYEKDEALNTIEPSVLAANCENGIPSEVFKRAISINGSMMNKSRDEILNFMLNNKAEWAMRVFDSEEKINYPEYIQNAIKEFS
jgi:putative ATP-dependent endonuclease of OLD family